jgi:hypothetical protein
MKNCLDRLEVALPSEPLRPMVHHVLRSEEFSASCVEGDKIANGKSIWIADGTEIEWLSSAQEGWQPIPPRRPFVLCAESTAC